MRGKVSVAFDAVSGEGTRLGGPKERRQFEYSVIFYFSSGAQELVGLRGHAVSPVIYAHLSCPSPE